jgi:hypothetical protein
MRALSARRLLTFLLDVLIVLDVALAEGTELEPSRRRSDADPE